MMPSANSCAPENNATIDARNGKPGDWSALQEVTNQNVDEDAESEQREEEADQAGDLQGLGAEAGHHVHGVRDQLAEGVSGNALAAGFVTDWSCGESVRTPGEQHVDGDEGAVVVIEGIRHFGAEDAERAYLAGDLCAHDAL